MKGFLRLLVRTFKEWRSDNPALIAAGLSFFSIFSLAPLLLVAIAVTARIFSSTDAQRLVIDKVADLTSLQAARAMDSFIGSIRTSGDAGSVIGLLLLLWAASRVIAHLQGSLRVIWEAEPPGRSGWRKWGGLAFNRVRALLIAVGLQIFLLAFFLVDVVLAALQGFLLRFLPEALVRFALPAASFSASILIFALLFAMTYRWLPRTKIAWTAALAGGAFASCLFTLGRYGLTLYFRFSDVASASGAAGSVVLVLLWVYFSAHVFLLGAEFAWVYANRHAIREEKVAASSRRNRIEAVTRKVL